MPKHIVRLISLLVVFLFAALVAKAYFTADSFYEYGHFRANSVPEIAAQKPVIQTSATCKTCHAKQYAEWASTKHKAVKCEVCHGAAGSHPATKSVTIPKNSVALCTLCHERMTGRPAAQPQIDVAAHAGTQQCVACHNPHSPPMAIASSQNAAPVGDANKGKALAQNCAGCHGESGVSANPSWPNLAGQNAGYLVNALKAFAGGSRSSDMMGPLAKTLNDEAINNVAAYFSSLKCSGSSKQGASAKVSAGKALAGVCSSCHGASGASKNPVWPSLAGQNEAYLASALQAFKNGSRKDPMMARIAQGLNEADIAILAAYFSNLPCGPAQ
jgi:cytochrome c553